MQRKTNVHYLGLSALALIFTGCNQPQYDYDSSSAVVDETYVHRYGVPVSQEDWSASGNHGKIVTTMASGVVVSTSYDSGVLDGDTTYTYPHSSAIEKVDTYANGVIQKQTSYYMSGATKQEVTYNSPQNRTHVSWYESGAPKSTENYQGNLLSQGTYYGDNNQVESEVINSNGKRIRRDDYGQLVAEDTIQNGQQTTATTYHPNGSPKEVYPYENGKINGQVKTYLPAGEPKTVEAWKDGVPHGTKTEYVNGEKVSDTEYMNGQKHGTEQRYRDGTEVVHEITWNNGQKQGPSTSYLGNNPQTTYYHQDKPVSKSNYDLQNQASKKTIWNQGQQ
jgi:antitoxin component YwqK of YwqJK toxin-antitoxin module